MDLKILQTTKLQKDYCFTKNKVHVPLALLAGVRSANKAFSISKTVVWSIPSNACSPRPEATFINNVARVVTARSTDVQWLTRTGSAVRYLAAAVITARNSTSAKT